jgi:hypothetical protein
VLFSITANIQQMRCLPASEQDLFIMSYRETAVET